GQVDSKNFMTWEQLMEMQNHHMQIESHTHTHTPLELLSKAEIEWEVNHPKEFLEKHLGKQVKFISLPHGSYNRETLLIARKAHYLACATSNFGYATPKTNAYTLPRILLRRNHDISQFARLCEGGTLIWLRERLIHQSKSLIKDAIGIGCYNKLHKIRYRLDHARS
ncbi:polysaccharide deacetylase family protein, partial [candidate division KSB1 bacterium]|nr:polysaccharide deacetylase family protein [candidate division KSB1 bacterium]NIR71685.1 polysaccharide deacetylase family protein [candidate division KSB1 bacterium]NIS26397.1 polysaccharide deacetylase family protein [candidate division KSB1 bacterium]NIT73156.1 polysaccharide deacetylase family protein [candidate division KSB1 bacterium]NIU27082.1 polysaccharide deacetylase family protein [candidate division KSB1 bacterium]